MSASWLEQLSHEASSPLLSCPLVFREVPFRVYIASKSGVQPKANLIHTSSHSLSLHPSLPAPASSAFNMPCWAVAENTQQTHIKNAL